MTDIVICITVLFIVLAIYAVSGGLNEEYWVDDGGMDEEYCGGMDDEN